MIVNFSVANQVLCVHFERRETTHALLVSSALIQVAQSPVKLELTVVAVMLRK